MGLNSQNLRKSRQNFDVIRVTQTSDKKSKNSYLLAELPVTEDMRSLKVRNMPLRETNLEADSDFGNW